MAVFVHDGDEEIHRPDFRDIIFLSAGIWIDFFEQPEVLVEPSTCGEHLRYDAWCVVGA